MFYQLPSLDIDITCHLKSVSCRVPRIQCHSRTPCPHTLSPHYVTKVCHLYSVVYVHSVPTPCPHTVSPHQVPTPCHHTMPHAVSPHRVTTPCHHTVSTHGVSTRCQHTVSPIQCLSRTLCHLYYISYAQCVSQSMSNLPYHPY